MTIKVQHKFRSQKPDSIDASVIRPSNWNEPHTITMLGPSLLGRSFTGEGDAQEITMAQNGGLVLEGGQLRVDGGNATTLANQPASYYTNIPARLGFTPVISDNPGRLRIGVTSDGYPTFTADNVSSRLTTKAETDAVLVQAQNAISLANSMFNNLRLGNGQQSYDVEFLNGFVMTGAIIQGTNGVMLKVIRQVQGFSPSRGWIAAHSP